MEIFASDRSGSPGLFAMLIFLPGVEALKNIFALLFVTSWFLDLFLGGFTRDLCGVWGGGGGGGGGSKYPPPYFYF